MLASETWSQKGHASLLHLLECPESTHQLFSGRGQQSTPGSQSLKLFAGKKKLNRLENFVAKCFQVYRYEGICR